MTVVTMTPAIAITQWLAFLACVCLGYFLSRLIQPPTRPIVWLLMILVVFLVGYLPFLMIVIWIFGAPVMITNLLWGVGIGIVIGLMIRQAQKKPAGPENTRPGDSSESDTRKPG